DHHRDDLLLAGRGAAGGRLDRRARLPGRPGDRADVRALVHVLHTAGRPGLRLARPTHLLLDESTMSTVLAQAGALPREELEDESIGRPLWARLRRQPRLLIGGALLIVLFALGILAPVISPYDPIAVVPSDGLFPPSAAHLLGTDDLGRDVLSRVVYGARVSL